MLSVNEYIELRDILRSHVISRSSDSDDLICLRSTLSAIADFVISDMSVARGVAVLASGDDSGHPD